MKQNKRRIAITGGIGSGKSAVATIIAEKGYPVFSCDEISRKIYSEADVSEKIAELFPSCITDGAADRKKLSDIVFSDRSRLRELENITHPAIMRVLKEKMEQANAPLVFAEVPLLFEGGYADEFDGIIVVMRNGEDRISSVVQRDGVKRNQVEQRIKNQFDYENKMIFEHTVIYNDGSLEDLREKVGRVLENIEGE